MVAVWASRDGHALWSGRLLEDWVPTLVQQVVEVLDPVAVWLFGSVARGDDDADSDIDLLVVLSDFDPATVIALKLDVLRSVSVPAPFDIAFTDSQRFGERRLIAGTLERAAAREGRVVYERA
jgi:predicted nucleotidyltransferase